MSATTESEGSMTPKVDREHTSEKVLILSAKDGLPTESWWLTCATRDALSAKAKQEVPRMQASKEGRRSA